MRSIVVKSLALLLVMSGLLADRAFAWEEEVRTAAISDAVKGLSPRLLESVGIDDEEISVAEIDGDKIKFVSYNEARFRLHRQAAETLRAIRDEEKYLQGTREVTLEILELFDPFAIASSRGLFTEQGRAYQQSTLETLAELRGALNSRPAFAPYSSPYFTSQMGLSVVSTNSTPKEVIEDAIAQAEKRAKRVMALYLRGYTIYDLRGEQSALYADMVRTARSVLNMFLIRLDRFKKIEAFRTGSYLGKKVSVEIGDWYESDGVLRNGKLSGLKVLGTLDIDNDAEENDIENTIITLLENQDVREALKKEFGVSDRDINTSGVEVELSAAQQQRGYRPRVVMPYPPAPFGYYPMPNPSSEGSEAKTGEKKAYLSPRPMYYPYPVEPVPQYDPYQFYSDPYYQGYGAPGENLPWYGMVPGAGDYYGASPYAPPVYDYPADVFYEDSFYGGYPYQGYYYEYPYGSGYDGYGQVPYYPPY